MGSVLCVSLSVFACLTPCVCGCLSFRLPACVPACPSFCLPACVPACVFACLPACLCVSVPACVLTYVPAFLRACLLVFNVMYVYACASVRACIHVCIGCLSATVHNPPPNPCANLPTWLHVCLFRCFVVRGDCKLHISKRVYMFILDHLPPCQMRQRLGNILLSVKHSREHTDVWVVYNVNISRGYSVFRLKNNNNKQTLKLEDKIGVVLKWKYCR